MAALGGKRHAGGDIFDERGEHGHIFAGECGGGQERLQLTAFERFCMRAIDFGASMKGR
jgi:hypothetical protein